MRLILFIAVMIAIVAASPLRGVMIKKGVSLIGLQPVMGIVIAEGRAVYAAHGYAFVITSGLEGTHSRGSLHFVGLAVDFRVNSTQPDWPGGVWNIPLKERQQIRNEIRAAVGAQWDIVLKPNHIHNEFQPKVGTNQVA